MWQAEKNVVQRTSTEAHLVLLWQSFTHYKYMVWRQLRRVTDWQECRPKNADGSTSSLVIAVFHPLQIHGLKAAQTCDRLRRMSSKERWRKHVWSCRGRLSSTTNTWVWRQLRRVTDWEECRPKNADGSTSGLVVAVFRPLQIHGLKAAQTCDRLRRMSSKERWRKHVWSCRGSLSPTTNTWFEGSSDVGVVLYLTFAWRAGSQSVTPLEMQTHHDIQHRLLQHVSGGLRSDHVTWSPESASGSLERRS